MSIVYTWGFLINVSIYGCCDVNCDKKVEEVNQIANFLKVDFH